MQPPPSLPHEKATAGGRVRHLAARRISGVADRRVGVQGTRGFDLGAGRPTSSKFDLEAHQGFGKILNGSFVASPSTTVGRSGRSLRQTTPQGENLGRISFLF